MKEPTSAVVVAGGLSRRLGTDKRRLRLWGESGPTLLEHTIALLATLADEVLIVLNDPAAWPALPARAVPDAYPDAGALGGLATGLAAATHPHVLVVASDMPLLNPALLQAMLTLPRTYDVLVAQVAPEPGEAASKRRNALSVEPLHAVYSKACLPPITRRLAQQRYQIIGFFDDVQVQLLDPALIAAHDPQGHSFLSVNTPEQLAHVQALLGTP